MAKTDTFESTYTRYSFAPLVELGLVVAAWFKKSFGETKGASRNERKPGAKPEALGHAA